MTRILIAVTADISVRLLTGQLDYLAKRGFDVHLVVSRGENSEALKRNGTITVHQVDMARDISLKQDISALFQMIRVFRKVRPDISNVGTPKAGLLGSIAAFLTRTKQRIYTLRGLRIETETGFKRTILKWMEQLTMRLATHIIAISPSLVTACEELGLKGTNKMTVLGEGSSNGLDIALFEEKRQETVPAPFPNDHFVIGFTGRITKDKGVEELLEAFGTFSEMNLLLVGGLDEHHGLKPETVDLIQRHPRIHMTGFIANPAPFYNFMDVFVIPSYREGFSNVCLEAAAAELAVIGTNVTGIKDAVVDGQTGLLVEPYSSVAIQSAITTFWREENLRKVYALNGKNRVLEHFQSEQIWAEMAAFYEKGEGNHVWLREARN
ncbi:MULTISPECIES: glycosyltransferase family 4 protein [Listeria]|uniref:glycosyltransferase family 4 protein n=1 Tax=Listeria TaxID=1637 RepID=UPI000B587AD8|nr:MULTISPECIES: glycosyltransferase family 4 protein [Listeria]